MMVSQGGRVDQSRARQVARRSAVVREKVQDQASVSRRAEIAQAQMAAAVSPEVQTSS
jgi:hypothetical protein